VAVTIMRVGTSAPTDIPKKYPDIVKWVIKNGIICYHGVSEVKDGYVSHRMIASANPHDTLKQAEVREFKFKKERLILKTLKSPVTEMVWERVS